MNPGGTSVPADQVPRHSPAQPDPERTRYDSSLRLAGQHHPSRERRQGQARMRTKFEEFTGEYVLLSPIRLNSPLLDGNFPPLRKEERWRR